MAPSVPLFSSFDLQNPNTLRYLAAAVTYWCIKGRDTNNRALAILSPLQLSQVQIACSLMESNPLVAEIMASFLSTDRFGNKLLAPARDIQDYAVPQSFDPSKTQEYNAAYNAWKTRHPLRIANNTPSQQHDAVADMLNPTRKRSSNIVEDKCVGDRKRNKFVIYEDDDAVEHGSEAYSYGGQPSRIPISPPLPPRRRSHPKNFTKIKDEPNDKVMTHVEQDEAYARALNGEDVRGGMGLRDTRTPVQQSTQRSSLQPPMQRALDPFLTLSQQSQENVDHNLTRQLQREEGLAAGICQIGPRDIVQDVDRKSSLRTSASSLGSAKQGRALNAGKNRPKRTAYDRPLSEGCDITPAEFGVEDRSKLMIMFHTERDDPRNPGAVIKGDDVHYDWFENHGEVDFNSPKDIRAINTWRRQIFLRNFDPVRKTRSFWLVNEKQKIINLARAQLGRHGYVKWNRLANTYNREMQGAGVIQREGERLVGQSDRHSGCLRKDREAPWRTRSAIYGQAERWPEFKELLKSSLDTFKGDDDEAPVNERPVVDSGDDDEIPDPNPGPRKAEPVTKKKRPTPGTPSTLNGRARSLLKKSTRNTVKYLSDDEEDEEMVLEDESEEDYKVEDEDEEDLQPPPLEDSKYQRIGRRRGDDEDLDDEDIEFPNLYTKELGGIDRRN